ncbi:hypothetical protein GCM10028816_04640 [Spirosoma lituiforme]
MNALSCSNPEYGVDNNVGIVVLTNQFPYGISLRVVMTSFAGYVGKKADINPQ